MEVYELGAKPNETTKLAIALVGKHQSPWEAEQMIEQLNREEAPEQARIGRLKKSLSAFYGSTRHLAFVFTKNPA